MLRHLEVVFQHADAVGDGGSQPGGGRIGRIEAGTRLRAPK